MMDDDGKRSTSSKRGHIRRAVVLFRLVQPVEIGNKLLGLAEESSTSEVNEMMMFQSVLLFIFNKYN